MITTEEDRELVAELRRQWRESLETGLGPFRRELDDVKSRLKAFGERTSRPPGGSSGSGLETNQLSLSRQLADEAGFQAWLKSNKVPSSGYATSLHLPPSRKTGTPITNISPTQHIPLIYGQPAMPLRVRSLMPVVPVTSGSIEYTQETAMTPTAGVAPEASVKASMAITFALATTKAATIASTIKASVQALADTPLLQIWLDNRLMYACSLKEEDVIINGDTTNSIDGLMTLATPFVYTPLTTDNMMDVIAHAAGALQGQGYAVDGVIMNAADYTTARLLKNTVGSYLFMGTGSTGPDDESIWESTPLMWQVPMVISPSMPSGSFLIGGFQQSTVLFSRDALSIQIAFQNEDDFIRNLVCMRGELRSGLAVPVPAGILKGTFAAPGAATASKK